MTDTIYCIECRAGPHSASMHCSCCEDCYKPKCQCGYPPAHGGKLSAKDVRFISRANADAVDNIFTARINALLAHVAHVEAELDQARRPLLPGFKH